MAPRGIYSANDFLSSLPGFNLYRADVFFEVAPSVKPGNKPRFQFEGRREQGAVGVRGLGRGWGLGRGGLRSTCEESDWRRKWI